MAADGVAYARAQTEVGLAVEETRGTPVAPAFWLPVKPPTYDPMLTLIPDQTLQGSMVLVYALIEGMRYDKAGWSAPPYLESFPNLIRAELGSDDTKVAAPAATTLSALAAAGATTVHITTIGEIVGGSCLIIGTAPTLETHFVQSVAGSIATLETPLIYAQPDLAVVTPLTTHQFSLLNNAGSGNQPPSYTLTDYDGEEWRQLAACQLNGLNLKGNGTSLLDYTCDWFANPSITPESPTASYTGEDTPAPWTYTLALGGDIIPYCTDWEVDLSRDTKPIPGLTGTQEYFLYFAAELKSTGKLTLVEQSGSPWLDAFENGTVQTLDMTVFDNYSGNAMNIHCTDMQFKSAKLDRSKEWVDVPVEMQMLPSSADALAGGVSPIIVTFGNTQTTAY